MTAKSSKLVEVQVEKSKNRTMWAFSEQCGHFLPGAGLVISCPELAFSLKREAHKIDQTINHHVLLETNSTLRGSHFHDFCRCI